FKYFYLPVHHILFDIKDILSMHLVFLSNGRLKAAVPPIKSQQVMRPVQGERIKNLSTGGRRLRRFYALPSI
ncbi:MAG: hypothetical protein LBT01_05220, partial [Spirochaetaceae bacterium]|nr:hypothetical protein [Spirochaetaceae bacterium]